MKRKPPKNKATNLRMTEGYLAGRAEACVRKGFTKPKWISFCETMMKVGYAVELYEARQTVSKYVTVIDEADTGVAFKVRFSNHKPIESRELAGDCDFFVGHTNLGITTTREAISATWAHFKKCRNQMENAK